MVSAGETNKAGEGESSQGGQDAEGKETLGQEVTSEQRPRGRKPENTHTERLFQATALRWAEVGSVKSEEWQGSWSEGRGKRGGQ